LLCFFPHPEGRTQHRKDERERKGKREEEKRGGEEERRRKLGFSFDFKLR